MRRGKGREGEGKIRKYNIGYCSCMHRTEDVSFFHMHTRTCTYIPAEGECKLV